MNTRERHKLVNGTTLDWRSTWNIARQKLKVRKSFAMAAKKAPILNSTFAWKRPSISVASTVVLERVWTRTSAHKSRPLNGNQCLIGYVWAGGPGINSLFLSLMTIWLPSIVIPLPSIRLFSLPSLWPFINPAFPLLPLTPMNYGMSNYTEISGDFLSNNAHACSP